MGRSKVMSIWNFLNRTRIQRKQRKQRLYKDRARATCRARAATAAIESLEPRRLLTTLSGAAAVDEGAVYTLNMSPIPADLMFAIVDWGQGIDADGDGFNDDVVAYTAAEA